MTDNKQENQTNEFQRLLEDLFFKAIVNQYRGKTTTLFYLVSKDANAIAELTANFNSLYQLKTNHFCIISDRFKNQIDAAEYANQLLMLAQSQQLTLHIGITSCAHTNETPTDWVQHAKRAAQKAQRDSQNNFEFYRPTITSSVKRTIALEADLKFALERNELKLLYQPQVSLQTLERVGIEALIRWDHSKFGTISPLIFIPLAEKNECIIDIGEWVIDQACRDYKKIPGNLKLAINISPKQLASYYFVEHLKEKISSHNLEFSCIELELTENSYLENFDHSLQKLLELSDLGFNLSIDDYGTGYASLNYLRKLPVNSLKIDRSYLTHFCEQKAEHIMVKSTIEMAHALGLTVTAEGIETEAQLSELQKLQCDLGQGFLFSRPASLSELLND